MTYCLHGVNYIIKLPYKLAGKIRLHRYNEGKDNNIQLCMTGPRKISFNFMAGQTILGMLLNLPLTSSKRNDEKCQKV